MRIKILNRLLSISLLLALLSCNENDNVVIKNDYPITPVAFTKVTIQDNFWSKRLQTNREVTIPYAFQKCEDEGRMRNFERAGGLLDGGFEGHFPFDDSDVFKIIEGASYSLQTNPDTKLDAYIDSVIAKIAAAQEDDGYLATWKTISPDKSPVDWVEAGPRWHDLGASHELYNLGHLYEAAYAHYRATGKKNLLKIALKSADLIDETFGPGKLQTPPGHQIIETGLIKLYRITGDERYLNLARFFLDARGNAEGHNLYGSYNQDHLPVVKQEEAVGHAVRALYMYAGMTDIACLMNDKAYSNAVDKIWDNVVNKKIYITGGTGTTREGEAFGDNYVLPNLTSYNETCAAIANVFWNHRLFLLHGDAKYIDVLERTLYNGLISGASLEGDSFFYPNCLASDGVYKFNQGAVTRKSWFDCSCCPTNMIRFIPSVPDYIYAVQDDSLYVNLFIQSDAEISIAGKRVNLTQTTNYPWEGNSAIVINTTEDLPIDIKIRIPGWARLQPLPGDLYRYVDKSLPAFSIKINGEPVNNKLEKGYTNINRIWKSGDIIEIEFPMDVHRVIANENVKEDSGKVAIERGPIVYCAEWIDNKNKVDDFVIPDDSEFYSEFNDSLLNGVSVLRAKVKRETNKSDEINMIPYYAWSHRGSGQMAVWLNRELKR